MQKKIGFIGFGEIAQLILEGLLKMEVVEKENVYASAVHKDKLLKNCECYGIKASTNEDIAKNADIIFLAVKPHNFAEVKDVLKGLDKDKFVISVISTLRSPEFARELPEVNIIAAVPNVCVGSAKGVFVADITNNLKEEDLKTFNELLTPIAKIYYLTPDTMSIGGTIAGCTPAYSAMYVEALSEAAVKYGLNRQMAYEIISQMLIGTATMIQDGRHPAQIKDLVSSPKGSTIKGIIKLEENGFRNKIIEAIEEVQSER